MENAKKSRKYSTEWYNAFSFDDTRYYGVFIKKKGKDQCVLVDPKRYQKNFPCRDDEVRENMKKIMNKRKGPLFRPAREEYLDYNVNVVIDEFEHIRRNWEEDLKPLIVRILSEICGKQFVPGDDELLQSGIIDHEEAADRAWMKTCMSKSFAEFKKNELYATLYSAYFHQLASQVEGVILKILTRNGYKEETFNRKQFYSWWPGIEKEIHGLEGHLEFDKLYTIWCFLKHNSLSMYKAVKTKCPEILKEEAYEYKVQAYELGEKAVCEIMQAKFTEVLKTEAYGSGEYAVYAALQTKFPENLKVDVPKTKIYEQGAMAMYKALLTQFPELQKEAYGLEKAETYATLLSQFPDIQYEKREMARREVLRTKGLHSEVYEQGEMAWRYVELSDNLIETILLGVRHFLIEYCCLAFKEDKLEASWNSEEHFYENVRNSIREEQDPLGIDYLWV
jgi:hypothetical protein